MMCAGLYKLEDYRRRDRAKTCQAMIANIHGAHELGLHSLIKLPDDFPDADVMAGSSVFLPSMSKNAGKSSKRGG